MKIFRNIIRWPKPKPKVEKLWSSAKAFRYSVIQWSASYQTKKLRYKQKNKQTNKQTNLIDDVERKQTQCIVFLHFPWSTKFVECALGHPREHVNERVQPVLLVLLRERNHLQTKRQKGSIKEPIHQKHLTWKKKEQQCQFEIYWICKPAYYIVDCLIWNQGVFESKKSSLIMAHFSAENGLLLVHYGFFDFFWLLIVFDSSCQKKHNSIEVSKWLLIHHWSNSAQQQSNVNLVQWHNWGM